MAIFFFRGGQRVPTPSRGGDGPSPLALNSFVQKERELRVSGLTDVSRFIPGRKHVFMRHGSVRHF